MSRPGTKSWCALAATVQSYGEAEVLVDVPSEAFNPPPHVESRFIIIRRHASPIVTPRDARLYLRVINAAFAMRRKTLANNLKASFGLDQQAAKAVLAEAGLDERVRGESLDHAELYRVADALYKVSR
jgi:16S rRNA (adenine1518-N6/adenine1519-N6)-dimethyltransferase